MPQSATSSVSVWLARNESFRAQVVTNIGGIEYYSKVLQFATSDNVTELEQLKNRYDVRRVLQNPLGNADEIQDYLTPSGAYFFWMKPSMRTTNCLNMVMDQPLPMS